MPRTNPQEGSPLDEKAVKKARLLTKMMVRWRLAPPLQGSCVMHVGLASRGDYAFKKMFAVGCTWACEPDVNAAMWLQWDDVNSYVVAVAVA